jgi:phosphatidylglycerol:prolipoprotein diacylglycerol transferase
VIAATPASAVAWHTALEMAGIFVGMRVFAMRMRRRGEAIGERRGFAVAAGCIAGAVLGSRIAVWLDRPDVALAAWWTLVPWTMGQSIVGALIGGWAGVEVGKRIGGVSRSTGDAFVVPVALGIAIGRLGCFVAGLHDDTYGVATSLPWGVDFGDGVPRHPTQIYDIAAVAALALALHAARDRLARVPGLAFKLFLAGYLAWRLVIDHWKPVHFAWPGGWSGLQVLALAFLVLYLPLVMRAARRLR